MATASKGVDVSSWQHAGDKPIDWHKVHAAGITFAMIKATQGDTYTNPWLKEDFEGAHEAGLLCGAYHFFTPGVPPQAQAEYFGSALVGRITELGVYLDWEPATMADWQVTTDYNAFVEEAEKFRNPIGLYCDLSWHETFQRLGLVIKRWWAADPSASSAPGGATIWQRQAIAVDGLAGEVDIDELLSVRGINIPRPPKAAEVPFVAAHEATPGQVSEMPAPVVETPS